MTPGGRGGLARRLAGGLALLALACACPAAAQEPLVIRIRPRSGAGAEAALAAREALWARRQAHARAVLAWVCAGCLRPWEPDATPARPARPAAALAGLETDPAPGASEPPADPANLQERP